MAGVDEAQVGTHIQGAYKGAFLAMVNLWFIYTNNGIIHIDPECTAGELYVINKSIHGFNPYLA